MSTQKVENLKRKMIEKTHHQYRDQKNLTVLDNEKVKSKPFIIRKALALEKLLSEMPKYIQEGELIVGGRTLFGLPRYITEDEIKAGNPNIEVEGYFNIFDMVYNLGQDERGYGIPSGFPPGHYNVLTKGFNGIKEEAKSLLRNTEGDSRKEDFYKAVIITSNAATEFALGYSHLAKSLAENETNSIKRKELKEIARICSWISANPPRTFWEALQTLWFTHLIVWAEESFLVGIGRFDQMLYPYYRKDLETGRLIKNQAQELLECLWIKFQSDIDKTHGGKGKFEGDTGQVITLGGITPDGEDATNELSYMCLQVSMNLRMIEPSVCVRLHKNVPDNFLQKTCELAKLGMGFPTIVNDDVMIPALQRHMQYTLQNSRDYAVTGCWVIVIPGRNNLRGVGGIVDFLRCLEWVFNDGKNFLDSKKLGLSAGSVTEITSFDSLINALKNQIKYHTKKIIDNANKAKYSPAPFLSSTMDDCLRKGEDMSWGGARYNDTLIRGVGLPNIADSLAVINKMVYQEKKLSLSELKEILISNFEDREDLRQAFIHKVPKFGNDNDEVDLIAKDIGEYFCQLVVDKQNNRGGRFAPVLSSGNLYLSFGKLLGASADGRKAKFPFAPNLSPHPGCDKKGPTAVVKSITKIDLGLSPGSAMLDLKFHPTALHDDKGTRNLMSFVKTFLELGGNQVQFNVMSRQTLEDAMEHPDRYRNLIIRVWGFSAYFVSLPREYQEHIIARTEYR